MPAFPRVAPFSLLETGVRPELWDRIFARAVAAVTTVCDRSAYTREKRAALDA